VNLPDASQEPWLALLYRKYARSLLAYLRLHAHTTEDAEDLTVEVFLAALENERLATLPERVQQAWLWRVAKNKLIDGYRRSSKRQNITLEQVEEHLYEDEAASPELTAVLQEDYADLQMFIRQLPALQQEILRLRFEQNLSCRDIAMRLDKQENNIRVALSRSLNMLRRIYQQQIEVRGYER
jgi:RNA polymerase sigma factor (sigma-70 family)